MTPDGWTKRGCPVCRVEVAEYLQNGDVFRFRCPACDEYFITENAVMELGTKGKPDWWLHPRRAALSHFLRTRRNVPFWKDSERPALHSYTLQALQKDNVQLPNRLVQMDNAVRYLGELETDFGVGPERLPKTIWSLLGAPSIESVANLFQDMVAEGFVAPDLIVSRTQDSIEVMRPRLTLRGWRRFGDLREGATQSPDGFIAMQFGDKRLDKFIVDVIQAGVKEKLGVSVHRVDSPDKMRAGLIDNIMREAIEDAAFVLVELSHGNKGAYWEAGLAEGLRKPVIYLCEQDVWDDPARRPHFDVNHRMTVMWEEAKPDIFIDRLVATIKNSLRIDKRGKEKAG